MVASWQLPPAGTHCPVELHIAVFPQSLLVAHTVRQTLPSVEHDPGKHGMVNRRTHLLPDGSKTLVRPLLHVLGQANVGLPGPGKGGAGRGWGCTGPDGEAGESAGIGVILISMFTPPLESVVLCADAAPAPQHIMIAANMVPIRANIAPLRHNGRATLA